MHPQDKRYPEATQEEWLSPDAVRHAREEQYGMRPMTKEEWKQKAPDDNDGWIVVWMIVLFIIGCLVMGALAFVTGVK
jgi:hypothetical protein